MAGKTLIVHVIEAKNLVPADSNGKSDPYVKLSIPGQPTHKTKTIKKNLDPRWNEQFKYTLVDTKTTLSVNVFDSDMFGRDDPLGSVKIDVSTLKKGENQKWYNLADVPKGQIHLNLNAVDFGSTDATPAPGAGPQGYGAAQPGAPPGAQGFPPGAGYASGFGAPPGAYPPGFGAPGAYPPGPAAYGSNFGGYPPSPYGAYPPPQQGFPPGAYPPGAYPPPQGAYPPGAQPGGFPPGAYPPGAFPPQGGAPGAQPGGFPPGAYPPGAFPPQGGAPGAQPGAFPPGAFPPQGAYPPPQGGAPGAQPGAPGAQPGGYPPA